MHMRMWISAALLLAACGKSDRNSEESGAPTPPAAPQSAKEAMALVCDAKPDIASMRTLVTNAEIGRVLDELSLDTWPSARERLVALARQHGVEPCALAATPSVATSKLPVTVPIVAGRTEPDTTAPLVVVSPARITYEGTVVVALDKGHLANGDLVKAQLGHLVNAGTGRVRVAFDRSIPVDTAISVITSVAGKAEVAVVGEQNHETVLVPLELARGRVDAAYAVQATQGRLTVSRWNAGKPGAPLAEASLDGGLGQILRALVEERARDQAGGAAPGTILLVIDPSLDFDRLLALYTGLGALQMRVVLSPGPS